MLTSKILYVELGTPNNFLVQEPLLSYRVRSPYPYPDVRLAPSCWDINMHNLQFPIVQEPLLSYRVRSPYPYPDVRLASKREQ
jgi:hypothetical protein